MGTKKLDPRAKHLARIFPHITLNWSEQFKQQLNADDQAFINDLTSGAQNPLKSLVPNSDKRTTIPTKKQA